MIVVRIVLGALIALLVVAIAVPAVVLVDLVIGGSGLGMCPGGLGVCDTSLFTLLEMALVLSVVTALGFAVAGCARILSRPQRPQV